MIVGAGASRDWLSGWADSDAPPLTKDLFSGWYNATLNRYSGASQIARLVLDGGGDVEVELQKLRDQSSKYRPRQNQLVATQFYFQNIIGSRSRAWAEQHGGMTNYAALVGALEYWRDSSESPELLYVTFNYDNLLEFGLEKEVQKSFDSIDAYLDDDRAVVKVHGSWNWKRRLTAPALPAGMGQEDYDELIKLATEFEYGSEYQLIDRFDRVHDGDGLLAPAVSIPVVEKPGPEEYMCPPSHLDRMRLRMHDITDVLVIGWRGNESHFLTELRDHVPPRARVTIVRSPLTGAPEAILRNKSKVMTTGHADHIVWLKEARRRGTCRVYHTGFDGFVRFHLAEWLLTVEP